MATSKTLTPTNVTIQIPAMTDAPDQSVNSNCIDKLGDAVNTLNSQVDKYKGRVRLSGNNTTFNIDLTNFGDFNASQFQGFLIVSRYGVWFAIHTVSGSSVHEGTIHELYTIYTTNVTIAYSTDGKTMTLTFDRMMYGGITVLG